ncbi:MAG TPA: metallophosphoesterase [Polyangia bacterium]|nr:metallophosphoesterase [Polyangia bacterium]
MRRRPALLVVTGALVLGCHDARPEARLATDGNAPSNTPQPPVTTTSGGIPRGGPDADGDSSDASSASPEIVAAGDIACGECAQAATADLIDDLLTSRRVAAVLVLGDEAYASGLLSEFQSFYAPAWGRPEIQAVAHPVPGNHEYATGAATGYFDYFDGPGQQTGVAGARDQGYYSFDAAGWHFIALNSSDTCRWVSCAAGSPQYQWLVGDLAAHPGGCRLAFWHHPRFQAGTTSGELAEAAPLWDALYAAGVDVVLNGHEHGYQQLAPLDDNGDIDTASGIRTFVVGTGGGDYDTTFGGPRAGALETTLVRTHGVLQMTLHPDGYEWQFVAVDGSRPPAASGSAPCH